MIVPIAFALAVALLLAGFALGAAAALKGAKKLHRKGFYRLPEDLVPVRIEPRQAGLLRFLAIGDVGTGDADQARVAATIRRLCLAQAYDFVLMLGDTFYETGLRSPDDPKFQRLFEDHYGDLGLPCFGMAGNHDVKQDALPLVLCSLRSRTWRMPNFSYAFETPIARFFLLNTNLNLLELMRLRRELTADSSRWTLVAGHHSFYANGTQGDWDLAGRWYWQRYLRARVDFYVCGHNHQLEHLRMPGQATDYVVSGAGGSHYRAQVAAGAKFKVSRAQSLFLHRDNGLVEFEVTATRAAVRYLDAAGEPIYRFERKR